MRHRARIAQWSNRSRHTMKTRTHGSHARPRNSASSQLWRRSILLVVLPALVAASGVTPALASTPWSWKATGTLGVGQECGTRAVSTKDFACAYGVSNPPTSVKKVTLAVSAKNAASTTTCYGLSVSTSYSAGLESFCVKAKSTGTYRSSGPATHYRQLSVSVFVTSGSKNRPIAPEKSDKTSTFSITESAEAS